MVPTGTDKIFQGMASPAYTIPGDKVRIPGNWKTYDPQLVTDNSTSDDVTPAGNVILGYLYDMEVKFPTIYYVTQTSNGYRSESQ